LFYLTCAECRQPNGSDVYHVKPHSAGTGRTVFSQLSAAVVRHKANDGVVYAIRVCFKYDTVLSAVVKACHSHSLIHCSSGNFILFIGNLYVQVLFEFMFVTLDYRKRYFAWLFLSVR